MCVVEGDMMNSATMGEEKYLPENCLSSSQTLESHPLKTQLF